MVGQTSQPSTSITSLAEAMRNTRSVDQTDTLQSPVLENVVSQSTVKPGFDSPELKAVYEAEQEKQRAEQARAKEINPVDQHDIFTAAVKRDIEQKQYWQDQLAALIRQKGMPAVAAPKIVDARIVNAGEGDKRLFEKAEQTARDYNPEDSDPEQPVKGPYGIWKGRQAKLRGHRMTASVQNDLTNNESNVHRGGGQ